MTNKKKWYYTTLSSCINNSYSLTEIQGGYRLHFLKQFKIKYVNNQAHKIWALLN